MARKINWGRVANRFLWTILYLAVIFILILALNNSQQKPLPAPSFGPAAEQLCSYFPNLPDCLHAGISATNTGTTTPSISKEKAASILQVVCSGNPDACNYNKAMTTLDKSYCGKVSDGSKRDLCYAVLNKDCSAVNYAPKDCWQLSAIINKDSTLCEKISTPLPFIDSVSGSQGFADKANCYLNVVKVTGDITKCDQINSAINKKYKTNIIASGVGIVSGLVIAGVLIINPELIFGMPLIAGSPALYIVYGQAIAAGSAASSSFAIFHGVNLAAYPTISNNLHSIYQACKSISLIG